jgi:hypothetical protein
MCKLCTGLRRQTGIHVIAIGPRDLGVRGSSATVAGRSPPSPPFPSASRTSSFCSAPPAGASRRPCPSGAPSSRYHAARRGGRPARPSPALRRVWPAAHHPPCSHRRLLGSGPRRPPFGPSNPRDPTRRSMGGASRRGIQPLDPGASGARCAPPCPGPPASPARKWPPPRRPADRGPASLCFALFCRYPIPGPPPVHADQLPSGWAPCPPPSPSPCPTRTSPPRLASAWARRPGRQTTPPSGATAGPPSSQVTSITPSPTPTLPCSGRRATALPRQADAVLLPGRASTTWWSRPSASSSSLPLPLCRSCARLLFGRLHFWPPGARPRCPCRWPWRLLRGCLTIQPPLLALGPPSEPWTLWVSPLPSNPGPRGTSCLSSCAGL